MHFICRSFSGNSESKSWSRYWENDPDDPILKFTKGHLFALININSEDEKELNSVGHDISYEFNQNYFNPENNSDILTNLQKSIDSIIKNPLYSDYKIDFVIAVVLKDHLYLATSGQGKIILKSQDKISILLDGLSNQTETLNGPIKNQDRIFLSTNSFFEKITWQKIKLFLSDSKIQNIEENFLSAIFSLKDQKNLAAALVEVEQEDQDISTDNIQAISNNKNEKSVFIPHHESREVSKRKKISLLLGIILVIVLLLSTYFGYQKNKTQKIENQYQALKTEIESQIENINKTKSLSLDSAREASMVAQTTIEKMLALKIHQDEIENYNSQLKTILSQTGSPESYSPDFIYDTTQIIANSQFQKIIFNDDKIYLLDPTNGRIDYFDTNSKSAKSVLISDKIKTATNLALDKINLYLMDDENIYLVGKSDLTSKISLADIKASDFKFWNGSAYVLDSENQTIWKFTPNSTGFSKAQNWLKNDIKLNLGAASLSINGKIWVLYQSGLISPFLSGVKQEFVPSQTAQFTKTDNIDVTQQKEYLSFVDDNNIVYIYQKSGELLSKYNLGNLKINDIAFNEIDSLIYVLCSDQKIYSIQF